MTKVTPLVVSLFLILWVIPAQSAVFDIPSGNVTALINAIITANANGEENTINLDFGTYTLSVAFGAISSGLPPFDFRSGLPAITGNIVFKGAGADSTIIEWDPTAPKVRIFNVQANARLVLDGVTIRGGGTFPSGPAGIGGGGLLNNGGNVDITNSRLIDNGGFRGGGVNNVGGTMRISSSTFAGNHAGDGGGLSNSGGVVTISNSIFADNTADGFEGGGITNQTSQSGNMTIANSTVSDNFALLLGGGISNHGVVAITDSTLFNNTAGRSGGGLDNGNGSVTITNSTVAGNTAIGELCPPNVTGPLCEGLITGGGISNSSFATVILINTTVADNSVQTELPTDTTSGGGIANVLSGLVQLQNTILALNTVNGGHETGTDCSGPVVSFGNNMIGNPGDCTVTIQSTDLTGDPKLAEFTDDGTPGNGHFPLLEASPAIDAGNNVVCLSNPILATDQIGNPRVGVCDIGSIEFEPVAVLTVALDVKPDSADNPINPKSNGVIPVAILSTGGFDASTVDQASLKFGPGEALAQGRGQLEDVNGDGRVDLVLHFRTQDAGIQCGDSSVSITGQTVNGIPIRGNDSIRTVGCNAEAEKKNR
jgi:hypothetical protein